MKPMHTPTRRSSLPLAVRRTLWLVALALCPLLACFQAQAQIAFVSGSAAPSGGGSSVSSLTVPKPAGLAIGDVMLVFISGQSTTAVSITSTLPSGWSSFAPAAAALNSAGKGISIISQYKVATAPDVAAISFVFNISPSARAGGVVQAFRGVDSATIAASAAANASSTTITAPAVAAVGPSPMIVAAFAQGQANIAFSPQASMSVQGAAGVVGPSYSTTGAGPNGVGIQIAQESSVAGAGAARIATSSVADIGAGIQVALKKLPGNFLLAPATAANPACMPESFALTARHASNATDTLYAGTATFSTSTAHGAWSLGSGAGVFTPGINGSATYAFAAADNGVATFKLLDNLVETYTAGASDGTISGTSSAVAQTNCNFLISPASLSGSACSALAFTITARDSANATLAGFTGTATLSTSTLHGAWSLASGSGTLTAGAANSGAATYAFAAGDGGVATLNMFNSATEAYAASAAYGPMSGTSASVVNNSAGCLGTFGLSMSTASGSTCATSSSSSPAAPVLTLTAKTASGAPFPTFTGTVSLSTSTTHGTWSLASGSGSFASGGADTGSASYGFVLADNGVATFKLVDERSESMVITATSAGAVGAVTETFSDNVFVIAPSDPLLSQVVAGRPHAFTASFFKKDPSNGACSVASGYAGAKSLNAWYAPTGQHPAGAGAPAISSSSTCASSSAMGGSSPATANFTTPVFAAGVATFYLCTTDVGQYAIDLSDASFGYAKAVVSGASPAVTARPFGLWIDSVASGSISNPAGTASSGSKFITAQSAFTARVAAKAWASGQDSINAGTPNPTADLSANASTPSFAAATTVAPSAQTPSGGTLGTLSGASLPSSSFSSGSSVPTLAYSEAGSAKLTASSANFLASSFDVPGVDSSPIGRFYPSALSLASSSQSPACSSGGFSYMGQSFALAAQLKALGSAGGLLSNYDAALGYAYTLSPAWRAVDSTNGADLGARLSTGPSPSWSLGLWTYSYASASFARLSGGPDGAYDSLQAGLSGSDPDGASIAALDMSYASAGSCSGSGCNAKAVGSPTRARFGRLEFQNAYGSVLSTLRAPVQSMFWSRSALGAPLGWAPNTLDSCTQLPYASMSVGAFSGSVSSVSLPPGSLALSSGKATIVATRSGAASANVSGSALLGINLASSAAAPGGCSTGLASVPGAKLAHLQSNFCSAGSYSNNPAGKLVWGAPQGKSGSIVFWRETY